MRQHAAPEANLQPQHMTAQADQAATMPPEFTGDVDGVQSQQEEMFQTDTQTLHEQLNNARGMVRDGARAEDLSEVLKSINDTVGGYEGRYNVTPEYRKLLREYVEGGAQDRADQVQPQQEQGETDFFKKTFVELLDDNPDLARDLLENGVRSSGGNGGNNEPPVDGPNDPGTPNNPSNPGNDPEQNEPQGPRGIEDFNLTPEEAETYAELNETLAAARDEYIKLSAKRRGISFFGRKASKRKLAEAKAAWDEAHNNIGTFVANKMSESGEAAEDIRMIGAEGVIAEQLLVSISIRNEQVSNREGKRLKPFYDWWARQGGQMRTKAGFVGSLKKAGVMGVAGMAIGIPAGLLGAAIAGPVAAAGLLGGTIARGVGRGLMAANIEKNAALTVADMQGDDSVREGEARIRERAANGEVIEAEAGSEASFAQTAEDVSRNRWRMVKSMGAGALAGAAGVAAGHVLHDFLSPNPTGSITKVGKPYPNGGPKGGVPKEFIPTETPIPTGNVELVPTDGRLPWTHMNNVLRNWGDTNGGANSTPAIKELVNRGKAYGIDFVGKGRGIESVTVNGQTFTDNAHINAAFDETLRRVLLEEAAKNRK